MADYFIKSTMGRTLLLIAASFVFFLIDLYVFQAVTYVSQGFSSNVQHVLNILYWAISAIAIAGFLVYNLGGKLTMSRGMKTFVISMLFVNYFPKVFGVLFLLIDDLIRLGKWTWLKIHPDTAQAIEDGISRNGLLVKTSLITTALPAIAMGYGIISGAHDYRVRKVILRLPNLPASFHGIRIAQISDVHSGSFYNKTAVKGGVDMLLAEKPDVVFFTGDLVNDTTTEVNSYMDVFGKITAPLGVYSTLGNHDYGDYRQWPSVEAKKQNLLDLIQAHKVLGWDLLNNENRVLTQGSDQIAILGVENWGTRFVKYGDLDKARRGVEEAPVKLLLSHDPSHWEAQVLPKYPDIDLMLAGHTHGMQFGVEAGDFKWSPVQYVYKQWAGLYQQKNQYLYVNRGYGYLAFPGRVGILPEITIIELEKA